MKRVVRTTLLVFFWLAPASAQYEFAFSGYVMDLPVFQRVNALMSRFLKVDRNQNLNIIRVRLRPTMSLWEGGTLALEYEVTALYHSTPLFFPVQPEMNSRQVVDLTWNSVQKPKYSILHFIDRLHFRQNTEWTDVVVGRQRIAWGTGRVWNPTDLFNPINPASFAKIEKDGVDAISAKIHFGSFTDLSLVYNPQKGWETSNAGFRFRTNVSEFDLSLVGGHFDKRVVVGGDFAGNLLEAGVRGEGIVSAMANDLDSNFVKFILGTDYQFTPEIYALAEYHFNGEGSKNPLQYDLTRLAKGEILNVGRNYFTIQASYLVHPLVNVLGSWTRNFDDKSQFFGLLVSYSATEEMTVGLGGQLFLGDDLTEYWYYPKAVYLKADLFF